MVHPHSGLLFIPKEEGNSEALGRLARHRAASRPGLCAIAPGRRAGAPPVWNSLGPSQYRLASTRRQPASSLPRSGHWAPNLGPK